MALDKKDHDALYNGFSYTMETMADYKHGGYHPVNINDFIGDDNRFELIRKLAHGQCSTVWLARDLKDKRYVAAKIVTGKVSRKADKTSILDDIAAKTKGSEFIVQEFEHFKFKGPNGNHIVSIQEVMGPDLSIFWHGVNDKRFAKKMDKIKLPMAKSILRQVVQGIKTLHDNGIAHGNISVSNIVLQLSGLDEVDHTYLEIEYGPKDTDKYIEAPKKQKGIPDRIVISTPLHRYVRVDDDGVHVKICDMNAAFDKANPPADGSMTSPHVRAPEYMLGGDALSTSVDIWSIGCLIFELTTNRNMFEFTKTKPKEIDDELLFEMNAIVGPLPDEIVTKWKPTKEFAPYVKDGKVTAPPEYKHTPSLEQHFDNWKPDTMKGAEATKVKALLQSIFQYDSTKRPTIDELAQNDWLKA